jgi:sarcosine oxidase subunit alpha
VPSIRLFAREHETDEATIGTTTARPPWAPVSLGLLAGRGHEPTKRTSIHHRHEEAGATMMWTGFWRRAHSYEHAANEALNVHRTVGLMIIHPRRLLVGAGRRAVPRAAVSQPRWRHEDRAHPLRRAQDGRGPDLGRGAIARLGEDQFYVTTPPPGADTVIQWFG